MYPIHQIDRAPPQCVRTRTQGDICMLRATSAGHKMCCFAVETCAHTIISNKRRREIAPCPYIMGACGPGG